MIANILFFMAWTVAIFVIASKKAKELIEVIHKNEKIYLECEGKLKLRSEQNDILMQTINNLNNQIIGKEDDLNALENFSGLLGKQYLFKQDDGTYYNRYTDEYMTSEEATDWLYSELSSIINKED